MISKVNSKQIFLNTQFSLSRIFQLLSNDLAGGITKDALKNPEGLSASEIPFVQFLSQQFKTVDNNKNAVISKEEFDKMLVSFQNKGFNKEQLMFLVSQTDLFKSEKNKKLVVDVLDNFNKIDQNRDGKVSEKEIEAYYLNKQIDEKKEELNKFKASDITTFYLESDVKKTENTETDIIASEE